MILNVLIVAVVANPFIAIGGTGAAGGGEAPRSPTVACYGDSITQGAGAGTPYPAALDGLLPGGATQGYIVSNEGISGETPHQIYARVVSAVDGVGSATACLGAACGAYAVQGMVNTLKNATYDEYSASALAEVALNGASASSSGTCDTGTTDSCGLLDSVDKLHELYPRARIFALGVTPYKGCDIVTCPSVVEPGERAAAANSGLLAACATRAWLTCVITYDALEDPENPDYLDPDVDPGDGIHLNNAGAALLAGDVYASVTW